MGWGSLAWPLVALTLLVAASVATLLLVGSPRGPRGARLALVPINVAVFAVWTSVLRQPWEGRTLLVLSRTHGVTTSDLIALPLLVLTAVGVLRHVRLRSAALSVTVAAAILTLPTAQYLVLGSHRWTGDFRSGDLEQWSSVDAAHSGAISLVHDPLGGSRIVARVEVRPGDFTSSRKVERAEVDASEWLTHAARGAWQQYDWELLVPASTQVPIQGGLIVTQFRSALATCTSNITVTVVKSGGRLHVRLGVQGGALDAPTCSVASEATQDAGPLLPGRWTHFHLIIRWADDPSGRVFLRLGDAPTVRLAGANVYTGQGVSLKQGLVRQPWDQPDVVFLVGATRLDLRGEPSGLRDAPAG